MDEISAMTGSSKFLMMIFGLPALGLSLTLPTGYGAEPKSIENEMTQERKRLEELQKKIAESKEKATKAEKQHGSVLKNIEQLDQRLYRTKKERNRIDADIKEKDQEIATLNINISDLEKNVQTHREAVTARLRLLYIDGRAGYLKTLFTAETFADAANRMDYIAWIAQRENGLVRQFQEDLTNLQDLQDQQAQARETLLALQGETQSTIKEISGLKRKKRTVLVSLSKEKDTHERAVEDLKRSAGQVDSLLKALDQRFQLAQAQLRKAPGKLPSLGSFLWPVKGKVVSFFGRQKHPTFDTYVTKKGIEIQAREGSPIHSVSSGNIVYADWLKGYGLVAIVDHTNGFYSLYAHASKLLVAEGNAVTMGQMIGHTGDTGVTENDVLYFELRKGTTPIDPLKWLVKR
ncbi:MAG: peptidoglycan DD-metalloendopeptidase family protein [Nitrospirota bacterium]|nr:peptidoglycan DD-metalloendopeptidase family protein [Nitrospirota bacterium]MDH5774372.1 peptidoglycan DD-metalloendopeptidase family protein [Nitrospirota bacterium]